MCDIVPVDMKHDLLSIRILSHLVLHQVQCRSDNHTSYGLPGGSRG